MSLQCTVEGANPGVLLHQKGSNAESFFTPTEFPTIFTYIRMSVALCTYYYIAIRNLLQQGADYTTYILQELLLPRFLLFREFALKCHVKLHEWKRANTEPRKLATVQHMQEHCCTRDDMYSICNNGRRCRTSVMSLMFDRTINLITTPYLVTFSVPIPASDLRMPMQI